MTMSDELDRKLHEKLLLARRVEGDRLVLADQVLRAAIDGTRRLSVNEREALRQSPLTLRRFRQLSIEHGEQAQAGNDAWYGSGGMLRAAAGGDLDAITTDDGHWKLHFVAQDGRWNVILGLDGSAPFAPRVLREQPMLRVVDAAGGIILQGTLDGDGEYESAWPFEAAPAPHFQACGAAFLVEPVH